MRIGDEDPYVGLPHALEQRREFRRRRRDAGMGLRRSHDLEPEPLGEIHPAVVHDDDLRAAVRSERRFPFGDLLVQAGKKRVAVRLEARLLAQGAAPRAPARIDAVIGWAL